MIQRCEHLRFALKATKTVVVVLAMCRQDFNCNFSLQPRVYCTIDLAHSALTEKSGDLICAELRADPKSHLFCGPIIEHQSVSCPRPRTRLLQMINLHSSCSA